MKSENQKLKILYICDILKKETDEDHVITTQQIINKLKAMNISAERKSIYSDINALYSSGYLDVSQEQGRNGGYKVLSREFELAELKMLVDAVQSSRFISKKHCSELIHKLSAFSSIHQEKQLQRSIYIYDRTQEGDGNVFYFIDLLHNAISENKAITFKYTELTPDKEVIEKHEGSLYEVSPFTLIWQDERYYLIGYDNKSNEIKHYRVDRLKNVTLTDEPRKGRDAFEKLSLSEYCSTVFEMFPGEEAMVRFRAKNYIAGAMFDRFGKNIVIEKFNDYFEFYAKVSVSVRFFGWVFGFDGALQILSPEKVVNKYKEQVMEVFNQF